jgi:hypothetical protein
LIKEKTLLAKNITIEKGPKQCWEKTSLLKCLNMCSTVLGTEKATKEQGCWFGWYES